MIESIQGIEEARKIPGVREVSVVHQAGEKIGAIGSSADRVGFVIAQADTAEDAAAVCVKALETVKINMV